MGCPGTAGGWSAAAADCQISSCVCLGGKESRARQPLPQLAGGKHSRCCMSMGRPSISQAEIANCCEPLLTVSKTESI